MKIKLTNPGIISRLDQDIADYLSPFGYRLTSSPRDSSDVCTAVLSVPLFLETEPVKTLYIYNHDEDLIPTIGPLIRTYLRLSDSKIHPQRLRVVVDCMFVIKRRNTPNDHIEYVAAKRMAHHIHMIVRNSMGSALCLEVVIVLPLYEKNSTENVHLPIQAVKNVMHENIDACYPSIFLRKRGSGAFLNVTSDNKTLYLHVNTRMCTVRHQPKLFRWLHEPTSPETGELEQYIKANANVKKMDSASQNPAVIACIEKVANLHRILMLCYDYDKYNLESYCTNENTCLLLLRIVVVLPTNTRNSNASSDQSAQKRNQRTKKSFLEHYEAAIEHFHSVVFENVVDKYNFYRPKMVFEDEIETILRASSNKISGEHSMRSSIVGIDLHARALTLCGDYNIFKGCNDLQMQPENVTTPTYHAIQQLRRANAIVFGYESTGIPDCVQLYLNAWIQIPCRSSINVVASMSIIFDSLFGEE